MLNQDSAIGVFDSGIGGLTVLHSIIEALPKENTVYLGDTARSPYGTKSVDTVMRYSFENSEFLVEKGVKMVVVACNTSTAIALDQLQAELEPAGHRRDRAGCQKRDRHDQEQKDRRDRDRSDDSKRRLYARAQGSGSGG